MDCFDAFKRAVVCRPRKALFPPYPTYPFPRKWRLAGEPVGLPRSPEAIVSYVFKPLLPSSMILSAIARLSTKSTGSKLLAGAGTCRRWRRISSFFSMGRPRLPLPRRLKRLRNSRSRRKRRPRGASASRRRQRGRQAARQRRRARGRHAIKCKRRQARGFKFPTLHQRRMRLGQPKPS